MINNYYNGFDLFAFSGPMKPSLHTKYMERLALLILNNCSNKYSHLQLLDKPDLQMLDGSVGIEVTEAILPKKARINGELTKMRIGKQSDSDKARCKEIIEKSGGRFLELGLLYPVQTSTKEKKLLLDTVCRKLRLVPSYRKKGFVQLGLFVLFDEIPIPFDPDDLMKLFQDAQTNCSDRFDFLFFFYNYGLIHFDFQANQYTIHVMGEQKFHELSKTARIIVESDDQHW